MKIITLPGLIDPHVHLRTPGQTQKEDFYTGTAAALAGGFTTVLDMPNNLVPITTSARLEDKIAIAEEQIVCDVGFYFGSLGDNLEEFESVVNVYSSNEVRSFDSSLPPRRDRMIKDTVFGLKLYLNETTGNFLIDKEKLETIFNAWKSNQPILVHAEGESLSWVIETLKQQNKRVHVCHVSSKNDFEKIISAKQNDLSITCGVTPHHLFLTEEDAKRLGPYGMMKPPLQSRADVEFLWKNLKHIDVIESDHAPHTKEEKNPSTHSINSGQASSGQIVPFGVPGLETTLPLLLTAVSENRLSIDDVVRLCHTNPSKIFSGRVDRDWKIEVDMNEEWIVKGEDLQTKCKWTPFEGWKMRGRVKGVKILDKTVFEGGTIKVQAGAGRVILPVKA